MALELRQEKEKTSRVSSPRRPDVDSGSGKRGNGDGAAAAPALMLAHPPALTKSQQKEVAVTFIRPGPLGLTLAPSDRYGHAHVELLALATAQGGGNGALGWEQLRPGLLISEVGGTTCAGRSQDGVSYLIRNHPSRPLTIRFVSEPAEFTVNFHEKQGVPLGLNLAESWACQGAVEVLSILPETQASRFNSRFSGAGGEGALRPGLLVTAVNETACATLGYDDVFDLIASAERPVRLRFATDVGVVLHARVAAAEAAQAALALELRQEKEKTSRVSSPRRPDVDEEKAVELRLRVEQMGERLQATLQAATDMQQLLGQQRQPQQQPVALQLQVQEAIGQVETLRAEVSAARTALVAERSTITTRSTATGVETELKRNLWTSELGKLRGLRALLALHQQQAPAARGEQADEALLSPRTRQEQMALRFSQLRQQQQQEDEEEEENENEEESSQEAAIMAAAAAVGIWDTERSNFQAQLRSLEAALAEARSEVVGSEAAAAGAQAELEEVMEAHVARQEQLLQLRTAAKAAVRESQQQQQQQQQQAGDSETSALLARAQAKQAALEAQLVTSGKHWAAEKRRLQALLDTAHQAKEQPQPRPPAADDAASVLAADLKAAHAARDRAMGLRGTAEAELARLRDAAGRAEGVMAQLKEELRLERQEKAALAAELAHATTQQQLLKTVPTPARAPEGVPPHAAAGRNSAEWAAEVAAAQGALHVAAAARDGFARGGQQIGQLLRQAEAGGGRAFASDE